MIKGLVAALIDNRTLALNIGSKSKVKEGMVFQVFDSEGKKITDPESGKELGKLRLPKIKVRVLHVFEEYSVAGTYRYEDVNVGGNNAAFTGLTGFLAPPKYVRKYETFEIGQEDKKVIEEEKSIVKTGDIVEQVIEKQKDSD